MHKRLLIVFSAWMVILWPLGAPALLFLGIWWVWPLAAALLVAPTVILHERQLRRTHGAGWRELERERKKMAAQTKERRPEESGSSGSTRAQGLEPKPAAESSRA